MLIALRIVDSSYYATNPAFSIKNNALIRVFAIKGSKVCITIEISCDSECD